jgi:hypothetical protein
MEFNGHIHPTPAGTVLPGIEPPAPIGSEAAWTSELIWEIRKRQK